jgi:hypothetical protein
MRITRTLKLAAPVHGTQTANISRFVRRLAQALVDLTGGVAGERIQLAAAGAHDAGSFWAKLLRYANAGLLLGAGSPAGSDEEASALGIIQGHAYSVLQVRLEDGHRLIQLRNPWGAKEWQGDWSDDSPLWTARLKSRLNWVRADDGVFWMSLEDFLSEFAQLYVCKLPAPDWHEATCISEWRAATAGGCANHRTHLNNPTFTLTITRPTHVLVALSQARAARPALPTCSPLSVPASPSPRRAQEDRRSAERTHELFAIGVSLTHGRLNSRVPGGDTGNFIRLREVSFDVQLTMRGGASSTQFTMRPSTFMPGEECGFALRVYSDHPCMLQEQPRDTWQPAGGKGALHGEL